MKEIGTFVEEEMFDSGRLYNFGYICVLFKEVSMFHKKQ